jgi:hypothetical protein
MATKSAIHCTCTDLPLFEADKIAKLIPGWCLGNGIWPGFKWRWSQKKQFVRKSMIK